MTADLIALIQAVIREELRSHKTAELGIVTALHPHASGGDTNNYQCDVRLRDSGLELKRVQVCTQRIGAVAIPNEDDMVLVQFINGDIQQAVITGRLYNDTDRPPEADAHEWVYISPDGAASDTRRVYMEFPNGNTLLLDDDKLVIEMGDTTLTMKNGGDVELKTSAEVVVESAGNTEIKASGNLDLTADGDVSVSGMNVSITAQANATLEGSAETKVKGTSLKLAGMAEFSAA
jgi:phage baseplate assembly protein gpV